MRRKVVLIKLFSTYDIPRVSSPSSLRAGLQAGLRLTPCGVPMATDLDHELYSTCSSPWGSHGAHTNGACAKGGAAGSTGWQAAHRAWVSMRGWFSDPWVVSHDSMGWIQPTGHLFDWHLCNTQYIYNTYSIQEAQGISRKNRRS